MKTIVYLHGFISSPLSRKATMLGDYVRNCVEGIGYILTLTLDNGENKALSSAEVQEHKLLYFEGLKKKAPTGWQKYAFDDSGWASGPASGFNDHTFLWTRQVSAVPEPSAFALLLAGSLGALALRRHRRR